MSYGSHMFAELQRCNFRRTQRESPAPPSHRWALSRNGCPGPPVRSHPYRRTYPRAPGLRCPLAPQNRGDGRGQDRVRRLRLDELRLLGVGLVLAFGDAPERERVDLRPVDATVDSVRDVVGLARVGGLPGVRNVD